MCTFCFESTWKRFQKVLLAACCVLFLPANAAKEIAKMTHISRYRPGIVAAEVEAIS